uniref:Telomeric repeat-binding factor 2-interacting protein 1 n=1 Tax=Timema poppense TaxID=170557 RepID=A0A7R9DFD4_TIMPO|nr:unnamed protein product [Timema poppensis]
MEPGASGVSEHNTRTTLSILPSCQVLKTTPVVFPSISTEFLTSDLKSGDKNNPLSIEETNNYWDKITTCTRGSGEVVSVAGPYTIPLISPDMQLNKQSQFKPEFNFRDILEKKITWSEARSRWKIDDINLDQNPLPQTLCSVKPENSPALDWNRDFANIRTLYLLISINPVYRGFDYGTTNSYIVHWSGPAPLTLVRSGSSYIGPVRLLLHWSGPAPLTLVWPGSSYIGPVRLLLHCTNRSYSLKEEQTILKYIADNNMYDKVKGRQMWQFMASSRGINKRTWQSLKEHYIKSMIPRIDSFDLTKEEKNKFMWK